MEIIKAYQSEDLVSIQQLAYQIWPQTYGEILSKEQLTYMLEKFYHLESLKQSIADQNHQFFIVTEQNQKVGFFSIENNYLNQNKTRIHKLYLIPETQGKGLGKEIINFVEDLAKKAQNNILSLNVNRYNTAYYFYKKLGFETVLEEDILLEFDFLMEDYLMEKIIL